MERVTELAARAALSRQTQSASSGSESRKPANELSPASVETLFRTFGRRWSHKWEKTNADPKARALWLHDLRTLGVDDEVVRVGLTRSAALDWPPSPAEFAALCKPTPEDLGIPALESAYREAMDIACRRKRREDCSHAVVWHALIESGDLGHMPEDKGRKAFEYTYRVSVDMAMRGEPLRAIPKALPKPEDAQPSYTEEQLAAARERAMAAIDAMRGKRAQGAA